MGNLSGFDARTVEPTGFEPLPAGNYEVLIASTEVKETASGNGKYLKIELQIPEGQKFAGRKLFDNLNIWNPSDKASQFAKGTLSAICRAVGIPTPDDSSDLHGKRLLATVVVENREGYGPQNRIKSYHALPGATKVGFEPLRKAEPAAAPAAEDDIPF